MSGPRLPRRDFLAVSALAVTAAACARRGKETGAPPPACGEFPAVVRDPGRVVLARTGSPGRNAAAVLDAWGGAESLFGPTDVVVLKANAQWYAQGMTNTDVLEGLARAILDRPGGFDGEVIVADNHHFQEDRSRGWTTDRPNGRRNLLGLVEELRAAGYRNVAAVTWHDAGPNPDPWQGDACCGTLVEAPGGGEGYRWDLEECHVTPAGNRCAMTWPVFRSPVSGRVVDLRDGVFEDGKPAGVPLRLVNVSSLNHHSRYAGVTASIKNLMGVVDMTCGFQGPEPPGYFNTHYVGMKPGHALWRWAKRRGGAIRRLVHRLLPEEKVLEFEHTGGALGHWMRTVRMPDLHVVTAEWIGWGSRTREELSSRPGITLAARDPVALDATAAREVLLPATRRAGEAGRPFLALNDPDREDLPFRRFLERARMEIGGVVDPGRIDLVRVEG